MQKRKKGRPRNPPMVEMPDSTLVYIYARVSKEDTTRDVSLSVESQVYRCKEFLKGFVAERFPEHTFSESQLYVDDGVSGNVPFAQRPGGGRLSLRLRKGDVVVMSAWDRGFRNLLDFLDTLDRWRKAGIYVVTVSMPLDPTDEMHAIMIKIFGLLAETERSIIKKRMRDSIETRLKQGRAASTNVPYGYKNVGEKLNRMTVPCYEERTLGELIVDIYDNEEIGFYGVSCRLRDMHKETGDDLLLWRKTGEVPNHMRCRSLYERCKAGWPYYKGNRYEDIVCPSPPPEPKEEGDDSAPAD